MLVKALLNGQVTGGISLSGMQAGKEANTAEGMGRTPNSLSQSAATVEWASKERFRYRAGAQEQQMRSATGAFREVSESSGGLENVVRRDAHAKAIAMQKGAVSGDHMGMGDAEKLGAVEARSSVNRANAFVDMGRRAGFTGTDAEVAGKMSGFLADFKAAKESGDTMKADKYATNLGHQMGIEDDKEAQRQGMLALSEWDAAGKSANFVQAIKGYQNLTGDKNAGIDNIAKAKAGANQSFATDNALVGGAVSASGATPLKSAKSGVTNEHKESLSAEWNLAQSTKSKVLDLGDGKMYNMAGSTVRQLSGEHMGGKGMYEVTTSTADGHKVSMLALADGFETGGAKPFTGLQSLVRKEEKIDDKTDSAMVTDKKGLVVDHTSKFSTASNENALMTALGYNPENKGDLEAFKRNEGAWIAAFGTGKNIIENAKGASQLLKMKSDFEKVGIGKTEFAKNVDKKVGWNQPEEGESEWGKKPYRKPPEHKPDGGGQDGQAGR